VTGVTTIVDDLIVDTDTLFVDVSTDRVGINTATPTVALDVVGDIKSSAGITGASATLTNLTVDTNLIITNSTDNRVGINTTSPTVALDVTGDVKQSGVLFNADGSASLPSISFTNDTNTGLYSNGSDIIGIATNGSKIGEINTNGIQALDNILIVEDEKTAGTGGGNFILGAWRTRDLNTVRINRITGASLSSNQITLPSGRYRIYATAPAHHVNYHKSRLWNATTSSSILNGSSERTLDPSGTSNKSFIIGEFVLTNTSALTIEHQGTASRNTDGFGTPVNISVPEIYTQVFIQRLA
jgi:hypothetical protein